MKKLLFALMFILPMTLIAQTQSEMNVQAAKDYKKADAELNKIYQQVMKKYADNVLFIKELKAAQMLWVQFRDAEFKRAYPHYNEGNTYYGSMFSLDKSSFLEKLTTERTKTLKEILKIGPN
jgi:uncharacterized protein YecT (DUF1311 family)